jgi:hypothetical protein
VQALQLSALIVAAAVTIVRAPHAIAHPQTRLSWTAILIASLAFLARAYPVLDRYLGGSNVISLIQNLFAVTAFWLLAQAALNQHHQRPIPWWQLPPMLIAFVVPFLLIDDRGHTSDTFIVDQIAQTGTWLYASIYMAVFGLIAASLLAGLRRRQSRSYRFFLAGCGMVLAACSDEIASLTLDHFGFPNLVLRDGLRAAFNPLFYPGTILVIVGVASFTSIRFGRERLLRHRIRTLDRVCTELGIAIGTPSRREPVLDLYSRVIAIRDHETATHAALPAADARRVDTAEQLVMQYLTGPAGIHDTSAPATRPQTDAA